MKLSTVNKKLRNGLCITPYCRNQAREGRTKCNTCRARLYDKPLNRIWRNLKARARERNKVFGIPQECFLLWAAIHGFVKNTKLQSGKDITIDRKYDFIGYLFANIQPMRRDENSAKSWSDGYSSRFTKPLPPDEPF